MARVAIANIAEPKTGFARTKNYSLASADFDNLNAIVSDLSPKTRSAQEKSYGIF